MINGALTQGWLWRSALQPAAELDASGAVVARFVYAGGGNVPAYMVTQDGTYRILTDHLGSVRLAVDVASGVVAQRMAYDSGGRVLEDTNPGFQPFGFAGGLYDADTGLVRFGVRDYDAETGRWTARDPIGLRGGVNLALYAGGEPLNGADPTGLDMQSPAAHRRDYVKGEGTIPADGMCVYECTDGFLYNHTWVQFDNDPARSYGLWPNPYHAGYFAVVNPFGPGWFKTDDDSGDSPSCNPTAACRSATDEEEAAVEERLREEFESRPYFAGVSDCRAVADEAIRTLDKLQRRNQRGSSMWERLLRQLLGTSLLANQY
ncbi:MAG: RHS repeat-associated core domain-containing protein [Polyangiaceae bacterium]